jgi:hypothetical protein
MPAPRSKGRQPARHNTTGRQTNWHAEPEATFPCPHSPINPLLTPPPSTVTPTPIPAARLHHVTFESAILGLILAVFHEVDPPAPCLPVDGQPYAAVRRP